MVKLGGIKVLSPAKKAKVVIPKQKTFPAKTPAPVKAPSTGPSGRKGVPSKGRK